MITSILSFIVVVGVLIVVHELGHFLFARLFGVGVEKFSLGFGPRIFGKKIGNTDYRLSAIPFGGYVKMIGEEPDAELSEEEIPLSFTHKNAYKKIAIVAAGPIFNILLAFVIFYLIFLLSGIPILKASVGKVQKNSPSEKSGILQGDKIIKINNTNIATWDDLTKIIGKSNGNTLEITILRGSETIKLSVTPEKKETTNEFGETINKYAVGIIAGNDYFIKKLGLGEAVVESTSKVYEILEVSIIVIYKLISGSISTDTLGGPIKIAQIAGQQAKHGVVNFFFFIAVISAHLGLLNLLPIPVLDGGHIVFFSIEAIIGRPVNIKAREIAQQIGIFLLLLLMIYVFYNDIRSIFFAKI
ncbi:MAG: RIP metalloprotease RseP [Desulfobacterales bacterium]|nr:RIP metalloprotease RseP [Desulfobacterales bacterium]